MQVLDFFDYAAMVGGKYTMKTDDDTFVFVDRMLSELQVRRHPRSPSLQ